MVWSPSTWKNIENLKKIQKRTIKYILNTEDSCDTRSRKLNLLSLEHRRLLADVTFLYKALNGITNIDISPYIDFCTDADHYSFWNYDILSLKKKYARTDLLKHSYFHRVVDSWNTSDQGLILVRVFLCPCVGPFSSVGLTLTWFILGKYLALHITL